MKLLNFCGRHGSLEKHRYLLQFVSTCVTLILFPCIMSMIIVSRQSSAKLTSTYESYYMETTEKFAYYFTKKLNDICLSSYVISDDSRNPNNSASCLDQMTLEQNSFYLYPAIQTIAEYNKTTADMFGIYYYEIDRILTKSSSFSFKSFADDYLNIHGFLDEPQLKSFFSSDSANLVFYFSDSPDDRSNLLIGVRTKIGRSRKPVLLIYKLSESSIDTSLLMTNNPSAVQFFVLNENHLPLISFGPEYYETLGLSALLKNYRNEEKFSLTLKAKSEEYVVSAYKDSATGFTYMLAAPLDQIANGTQEFYSMNMRIMILMISVLLAANFMMIYINYRPIAGLLKKLSKREKNVNEFEAISDEINRMTDEISEQNMVIVDSLLGNILYGIPISEEMAKRISIPSDSCCFFVFAFCSAAIDTTRRTEIVTELLQHFSTKTYITDILFQGLTVLICMSTSDCKSEIFEFLNHYLKPDSSAGTELRQGITVSCLNDIKFSFESCFPNILETGLSEPAGGPEKKGSQLSQDPGSKLMQQIAQYIEARFTDSSLSQSSVADYFQISTYSLSRLFKNKSGIGFTEYVTGKRIRMAQDLLVKTNEAVSAIAVNVGIPNVNYFYKVFKTYTGMSPTKYRDNC
ncbi:MAG: AraC family transcriptional regulator [Clostridiaceae bacterium]